MAKSVVARVQGGGGAQIYLVILGHNPPNESELESATPSPTKKKKKKSSPRKIKQEKRQGSVNLPYPDVKRPLLRQRASPSPSELGELFPNIKDERAAAEGDDEVAGDVDVADEPQDDPDDEEVLPELATLVGRVLRSR